MKATLTHGGVVAFLMTQEAIAFAEFLRKNRMVKYFISWDEDRHCECYTDKQGVLITLNELYGMFQQERLANIVYDEFVDNSLFTPFSDYVVTKKQKSVVTH